MPRNTFSVGMLNSATPGLSKLAMALGGGQGAYQQGYDAELNGQSKLAATLAQMRNSDAQARMHDATAAETAAKTGVLNSRPDLYNEQVAASSGADVPLVQAIRTQLRTGQAPQVPMGPPADDGSMGVGSQQFDPAIKSKILQQLVSLAPMVANAGDLNPEQMAKARGIDRNSALSDAIIAGTANRNTVAGAQAAIDAKPLFHAGENGAVLDQYGGGLDTSNPLAQGNIGLIGAKSGAEKALAVDRYASAGTHNANTAAIKAANAPGAGGEAAPFKVPANFMPDPEKPGYVRPIPGGPADPTGASGGGQGSRSELMFNRVVSAGNEATAALKNISELPVTASTGWFGTSQPGTGLLSSAKSVLGQKMSPQEVQETKVMFAGVSRALGSIETSGLQVNGSLIHSMEGITLNEGDTQFTKLRKMAEIRQIVEKGLEVNLSNPKIPEPQKALVRQIIDEVKQAVPYTHHDLTQLQQAKNPQATIMDFARSSGAIKPVTMPPVKPGATIKFDAQGTPVP